MNGRITLIGGDRRFLYVSDFFKGRSFEVNTVFLNENSEKTVFNTVILPVPVLRNGYLNAPLTDEKISAKELTEMLPEGSAVYGGMISESFKAKCVKKGLTLTDYYTDETLLNENALMTARAVPFVLEENGFSVSDGDIFILGNGRCGSAVADVLSSLGGNVTVVTGKKSVKKHRFIHFEDIEEYIHSASLIVNTVPSTVLTENELKTLNRNTVIIEIASAPYGVDFDAALKHGINVIKAPSLPGRYFPKEAGEAIASTIFKEMN